jgi:SAM-dependent methyltransferase
MPRAKKDAPRVLSREANKYELYQEAVQSTKAEVRFMTKVYQLERSKRPISLREDFCATAYIACEWAKSDVDRKSVGVDLDKEQLEWGLEHNVRDDPGSAERVKLVCKNVLELDESGKDTGRCDIICAYNFSICYLFERKDLVKYFKVCKSTLKAEGLFFCDIFGGVTSTQPDKRQRELSGGIKYEFEQLDFCPITHHSHFSMSFKFPDGSKIKDAFTYDWRVWTVPEIRDCLSEAGFSKSVVWFLDESEGADNATYEPMTETYQRDSWHAYIVGVV